MRRSLENLESNPICNKVSTVSWALTWSGRECRWSAWLLGWLVGSLAWQEGKKRDAVVLCGEGGIP